MPKKDTMKKTYYSPYKMMEALKHELPACFKRYKKRVPLAIGILEQVIEHYANDKRFDEKSLREGIGLYCKSEKYMSSLIENAPRINIKGKTVGRVEKIHADYALRVLAKRKAKKEKVARMLSDKASKQKT